MFKNLDDIKQHCDGVFADTPPLRVESVILYPPSSPPFYELKIYLMAPAIKEFVLPLKSRLEEIKNVVNSSGFKGETQYGSVTPIGYHFELVVRLLEAM